MAITYLILLVGAIACLYFACRNKPDVINSGIYMKTMLTLSSLVILDNFTTTLFVMRVGIEYETNQIATWLFNQFGLIGIMFHSIFVVLLMIVLFNWIRRTKFIYTFVFVYLFVLYLIAVNVNWYYGVLGLNVT